MTFTKFHEALPGAPADFVLAAFESGETAEAASIRWIGVLLAERDELKLQLAEALAVMAPGVPALGGIPHVW